jgi:hypothetical protein
MDSSTRGIFFRGYESEEAKHNRFVPVAIPNRSDVIERKRELMWRDREGERSRPTTETDLRLVPSMGGTNRPTTLGRY